MNGDKPHFIQTPRGVMDCEPGNRGEPYISSSSKPKPVYDRTESGKKIWGKGSLNGLPLGY